MVESFIILNASGGDCLDDFDHLREDQGLAQLIGHGLPSSAAARKFLYAFHDEQQIEQARVGRLPTERACIPGESEPLQGLANVNRDLIQAIGARCASQKIATIDQDATIIESHKREAERTYEGERGYQPMLAVWAEMDLIVADEFRDGRRAGADGAADGGQAGFRCAAFDGHRVLLPRRRGRVTRAS